MFIQWVGINNSKFSCLWKSGAEPAIAPSCDDDDGDDGTDKERLCTCNVNNDGRIINRRGVAPRRAFLQNLIKVKQLIKKI